MIVTFFDEHNVEIVSIDIEGEGKYAIPLEAMYFRVQLKIKGAIVELKPAHLQWLREQYGAYETS